MTLLPSFGSDVPYPMFLGILAIALYFNAVFVFYYRKARQYKKQLEQYANQNSAVNSLYRPYNSAVDTAVAINQSNGKKIRWNMKGYTKYISIVVTAMTDSVKPIILVISKRIIAKGK